MSNPSSSRAVRHSKSLASIVLGVGVLALSSPTMLTTTAIASTAIVTTGCSGTCSDSETASCNNAHSSCVSACGDGTKTGASGLPEPDPNYQACVKSCNTKLCSCLDDCGSECDESNGNLSGS